MAREQISGWPRGRPRRACFHCSLSQIYSSLHKGLAEKLLNMGIDCAGVAEHAGGIYGKFKKEKRKKV